MQLYIWEKKITRDAKQKSTRLYLTIYSYFRLYALYLEGEDLKCSFQCSSPYSHNPCKYIRGAKYHKILNTLKEERKMKLKAFHWTFEKTIRKIWQKPKCDKVILHEVLVNKSFLLLQCLVREYS